MATSSDEERPRDKEFLFSRNRLNVAITPLAQCVTLLVAKPALLQTPVRTSGPMKLVSTVRPRGRQRAQRRITGSRLGFAVLCA